MVSSSCPFSISLMLLLLVLQQQQAIFHKVAATTASAASISKKPVSFIASSASSPQTLGVGERKETSIRESGMAMSTGASSQKNNNIMYISVPDAIQCHREQKLSPVSSPSSNVVFVDGSWWLKGNAEGQSAREAFDAGPRITGARFFDIDDVADAETALPHMMPPLGSGLFAYAMDEMGVQDDTSIVLYGQPNCPFVHRAWYTFIACGHPRDRVHLLDGSLQAWIDAKGPIDDRALTAPCYRTMDWKTSAAPKYSKAREPAQVVDIAYMRQIVSRNIGSDGDRSVQIIDARSSDRFYGKVDEPRPGLRGGHMPKSKNLFFMDVLDPDDPTKLKPETELMQVIERAGIDLDLPTVTTCKNNCIDVLEWLVVWLCLQLLFAVLMLSLPLLFRQGGSGATACAIAAALSKLGKDPGTISVYDGSWMEWGSFDDTPVVKTD